MSNIPNLLNQIINAQFYNTTYGGSGSMFVYKDNGNLKAYCAENVGGINVITLQYTKTPPTTTE